MIFVFLKVAAFLFIARFYSCLVFWFAISLAGALRAEDCGSLLEEKGYQNFNRLSPTCVLAIKESL